MIINHNITALNTYRQLNINSANQAKSMAKLSSGLRINSAADDAAGLSISEKMKGQIRGLDQASRNAQDGISMISTAEGALSETQDILQRMRELATQASNGTNTDQDRDAIQKEANQLTSEINRIGNTTEFNTKKLLNGGGVDPTTNSKVSSNGLVVPASLAGGTGSSTPTQAKTDVVFAAVNATATNDDGKNFTMNIGGKDLKVVYDSTATSSGISGNTITIKTSNSEAAKDVSADVASQINNFISNDADLKGNYTADGTTTAGKLTVKANTVALSSTGQLTGPLDGGSVSAADGAANGLGATITNTSAQGTYASNTIDFSNTKASDLVGTGIVIDGKKIDFYDSANGKYSGNADFAIDLNGARDSGKIVDTIVSALSGTNGNTVAADPNGTVQFGSNNSALTNVLVSKTDDGKLQLTANTVGQAGNAIIVGNNSNVSVTQTYTNSKLTGSQVDSAKGLSDGEQKVTITNVAASVENQVTSANGSEAATITVSGTADSGTYKVDLSTAASAQLQKYNSDTDSWDNVGSTFDATSVASQTIGDVTIDVTSAFADGDSLSFEVDGNHNEASLTEAGSDTAGTAVRVTNGQNNVTLQSKDGIGEATVNIGGWDASNFKPGESISWSFDTKAGSTNTQVVGGTFTEKFQIGANSGQTMTIDINDMRSQALGISSSNGGGTVTAKNNQVASYVATSNVTNGTDNNNVEYSLDLSTTDKASAAISVLDDAINSVSGQRSALGAYENRLDHTINNLTTSSQNITDASSRITDVDMAKEMMEQTKSSVLAQAAQAMLAQANQQPQQILQLLR